MRSEAQDFAPIVDVNAEPESLVAVSFERSGAKLGGSSWGRLPRAATLQPSWLVLTSESTRSMLLSVCPIESRSREGNEGSGRTRDARSSSARIRLARER